MINRPVNLARYEPIRRPFFTANGPVRQDVFTVPARELMAGRFPPAIPGIARGTALIKYNDLIITIVICFFSTTAIKSLGTNLSVV